jgi:hypothetical protein
MMCNLSESMGSSTSPVVLIPNPEEDSVSGAGHISVLR